MSETESLIKTMVSLQLDKEMAEAIDKAAQRREISRSAFIRKALQRVLDGEPK